MDERNLKGFNNSNKQTRQSSVPMNPVQPQIQQDEVPQKTTWQEFRDLFRPRDIKEVGRDILLHNIGPGLRNAIINLLKNTVDMAFGNKVQPQDNRTKYSSASQTMTNPYTQNNGNPYYRPTFKTQQEAVECANEMIEAMNEGKAYSVAEIYLHTGQTPRPEFYNYGWIQVPIPDPIACIGGWMIPLGSPKCFK